MKTGRDHIVFWFLYGIPIFTAIVVSLLLPAVQWLRNLF